MEYAISAFYIHTCIGACLTGVLLLCDCISVYENRTRVHLKQAHARWRISLLAVSLFAFIVFLMDGALVWFNWTGNEVGCARITIPHVLFYFFQKQAMYSFLYDRAKIVHESLRISATHLKYLVLLRYLLWFVIVIGFPISFYWSAFLAFTGIVSSGVCVFDALFPVVLIVIALADAVLEMGMLFIFLIPLWMHAKEMNSGGISSRDDGMKRMIRRNILVSSIALLSCMIGLITLCVLEWIANTQGQGTTTDAIRIWASFAIAFDNMIGVTTLHFMTSGWLPSRCGRNNKTQDTTHQMVSSVGGVGATGDPSQSARFSVRNPSTVEDRSVQ
jgi:hypothetical protein